MGRLFLLFIFSVFALSFTGFSSNLSLAADSPHRSAELLSLYDDPAQIPIGWHHEDLGDLASASVHVFRDRIVLELEPNENIELSSMGFSGSEIDLPIVSTLTDQGMFVARGNENGLGYEELAVVDSNFFNIFMGGFPTSPTEVRYRRFDSSGDLVTEVALTGKLLQKVVICVLPNSDPNDNRSRVAMIARLDSKIQDADELSAMGIDPATQPEALTFDGIAKTTIERVYVSTTRPPLEVPQSAESLADEFVVPYLESSYRTVPMPKDYSVDPLIPFFGEQMELGVESFYVPRTKNLSLAIGSFGEGELLIFDTEDGMSGKGFHFMNSMVFGVPSGTTRDSELDCVIR